MTEACAKKIESIVETVREAYPEAAGHEDKVRDALTHVVNQLSSPEAQKAKVLTPLAYLETVANSLPRKEEEPSNESRGSSLP